MPGIQRTGLGGALSMGYSYSVERHRHKQRKTNSPLQTTGNAVKETKRARGIEGDGGRRLYPIEWSRRASLGR